MYGNSTATSFSSNENKEMNGAANDDETSNSSEQNDLKKSSHYPDSIVKIETEDSEQDDHIDDTIPSNLPESAVEPQEDHQFMESVEESDESENEPEMKPRLPLLFIEEEKKKTDCNICQKPVTPKQPSLSCSSLCGKRQHLSCISLSSGLNEVDAAGIVWKCKDCCIVDSFPNYSDEPNVDPVENNLLNSDAVMKKSELTSKESADDDSNFTRNTPFAEKETTRRSSTPHQPEAGDFIVSASPNMKSKFFLNDIHPPDHHMDISNISIDGTLASEAGSLSPEKKNVSPEKRKPSPIVNDDNRQHNDDNSVVKYIVKYNATKFGRPKLYSSLGYSYIIHGADNNCVRWQCVRCNGIQKCCASVRQIGTAFYPGHRIHNHLGVPSQFDAIKTLGKNQISNSILPSKITSLYFKNKGSKVKNIKRVLGVKKKKDSTKPLRHKSFVQIVDNQGVSRLIDSDLGFSYILEKSSERTKLWACAMVETKNCEASVKLVGSCYIRSRAKHTHGLDKLQKARNTKAILDFRNKNREQMRVLNVKEENNSPVDMRDALGPPVLPLHINGERSRSSSVEKQRSPKHPAALQGKEVGSDNSAYNKQLNVTLPPTEERRLVDNLLAMHQSGVFLTNKVLIDTVKHFCDNNELEVFPASDNKPSRTWVIRFMGRYKELTDKRLAHSSFTELLPVAARQASKFHTNLNLFLSSNYKLNAKSFLGSKNAGSVFNCDVIELGLYASTSMKIAKGEKTKGVNVLCCISADGQTTNPVIINEGRIVLKYSSGDVDGTYNCLCSDDGEVNQYLFYTWLSQHFERYLRDNHVRRPVMLFLNGIHNYLSCDSMEFGKKNGIIFYQIVPTTARKFQPLTISVFPVLRKIYTQVFDAYLSKFSKRLPIKTFPSVFMKTYNAVDISDLAKRGFRESGLCPFDLQKLRLMSLAYLKKIDKRSLEKEDKEENKEVSASSIHHITSNRNETRDKKRIRTPRKDSSSTSDETSGDGGGSSVRNETPGSRMSGESGGSPVRNETQGNRISGGSPVRNETPGNRMNGGSPVRNETPGNRMSGGSPVRNETPGNRMSGEIGGTSERNETPGKRLDKVSFRNGYKIAMENMEKLFNVVVDPSVINLYKQKLEANAEYPDTTFLVWRGLQQLKEIPNLI